MWGHAAPRRQRCGAERRAWRVVLPSQASCVLLLGAPGEGTQTESWPRRPALLPAIPATPTRHALCHCHCPAGLEESGDPASQWKGVRLWQEAECRSGSPTRDVLAPQAPHPTPWELCDLPAPHPVSASTRGGRRKPAPGLTVMPAFTSCGLSVPSACGGSGAGPCPRRDCTDLGSAPGHSHPFPRVLSGTDPMRGGAAVPHGQAQGRLPPLTHSPSPRRLPLAATPGFHGNLERPVVVAF